MNLPETFYIALCVTILLLGAIYWFWTQLQYLQRKVNLLDNVVYEMKTLVSNLPGQMAAPHGGGGGGHEMPPPFSANTEYGADVGPGGGSDQDDEQMVPAPYEPPPESVAGDLEAERMASEMEFESFAGAVPKSEEAIDSVEAVDAVVDDLQPGGLAVAASKPSKKVSDASIESPLAGMSIKELRRMAEANGIPGSADMRKKDLITALRDKVSNIVNPSANNVDDGPKIISFDDIAAPDGE
jgi:hypothetical protein